MAAGARSPHAARVERVEYPAQLLVRDAQDVRQAVRARHALQAAAVLLASGTRIGIPLVKAGSNDFATSADWIPATGDVKASIDGGAQANIGTLPTYSNGQWLFVLTAAEFAAVKQGDQISVRYGDGANGRIWRFGGVDKNMLK